MKKSCCVNRLKVIISRPKIIRIMIQATYGDLHYDYIDSDIKFKRLVEKKKERAQILQKIEEVAKKNDITYVNQVLDLFLIILAIKDFALGGNAVEIAASVNVRPSSILRTAKYVFIDQDSYRSRFYSTGNLRKDIISIADGVNKGKITESGFQHLLYAQLQELMNCYRREKAIPVGSAVFSLMGIGLEFTKWVFELSDMKLEQILENFPRKLSITKFIDLISNINKNLEILKCMVYCILKGKKFEYISEIVGISYNSAEKYTGLIYNEKVAE